MNKAESHNLSSNIVRELEKRVEYAESELDKSNKDAYILALKQYFALEAVLFVLNGRSVDPRKMISKADMLLELARWKGTIQKQLLLQPKVQDKINLVKDIQNCIKFLKEGNHA